MYLLFLITGIVMFVIGFSLAACAGFWRDDDRVRNMFMYHRDRKYAILDWDKITENDK